MKQDLQENQGSIQEEQQQQGDEECHQHSNSENSQVNCLEVPSNNYDLMVLPTYLTKHKKKKKLMEGTRKCVPAKFKAPTTKGGKAMKLKLQRFQMLPRNKQKDFNNYFGGPTLEDMMELQRPGCLEAYPNSWDVAPTIRSPWELFKNYGYILEPEFALMFNQQDPLHAEEHLLPFGGPDSPVVLDDKDEVSRCEVMGMEEMLACAPAEGSLESMNMFVKGFMLDGQTMIKLDPIQDLYPLRQDEHYLWISTVSSG
jgi:hypothetical protein